MGRLALKRGMVIVNFFKQADIEHSYYLDYSEENLATGMLINIFGDEKKVIFKRDPNVVISAIEGIYDPVEPVWKVIYSSSRLGSCEIEINAANGDIISDYNHIATIV